MNRLIKQFCIIGFFLIHQAFCAFSMTSEDQTVYLSREIPEDDINDIDERLTRNRMPSSFISCNLSRESIEINGYDLSQISNYEIQNKMGECVIITTEDDAFLDYLFSLQGEYIIRFYTETYILSGYICL